MGSYAAHALGSFGVVLEADAGTNVVIIRNKRMEIGEAHANIHGHLVVARFVLVIALCRFIRLDVDLDTKIGELLCDILGGGKIFGEVRGHTQVELHFVALVVYPDTITTLREAYPCQ